jgi:hypothetical protein
VTPIPCVTDLQRHFPKLTPGSYTCIGVATAQYNCIAWAAGRTDRFWAVAADPSDPRFYWPPGFPREFSVAVLVQIFESLGYGICADGAFEQGYEKIAVFGKGPKGMHAARQLQDGQWSSKLGSSELIVHELEAVAGYTGAEYGDITHFLRRPLDEPKPI